jgi:hypothetical protein
MVRNSSGHQALRYVITTCLALGPYRWTIAVSLTDRRTMRFRMLLGRSAMRGRILLNPARRFALGAEAPVLESCYASCA